MAFKAKLKASSFNFPFKRKTSDVWYCTLPSNWSINHNRSWLKDNGIRVISSLLKGIIVWLFLLILLWLLKKSIIDFLLFLISSSKFLSICLFFGSFN